MAMQEVVPDAPIMDMDQFYKDYTAIGESIYDVMARGIIPVEDHGILRAYRAFAAYEIPFSLEQAADFQEAYVHYLQKISLSQIYRDTNPTEWFYIGDNYINDMEGAKQLGFRTIHLNRHKGKEGPASDYVVYSEAELIDLLEHLDAGEAAKKHKFLRQVKKAML